jgi:hypothetical protein
MAMTTDPTAPPCLSDDRLTTTVREADAMLGMWAELFRQRRTVAGLEGVLDLMPRTVGNLPAKEKDGLLYAALIRLTEPAP